MKAQLRLAALLAVAALLTTGCLGDEDVQTAGAGDGPVGELRYANTNIPSTFDPHAGPVAWDQYVFLVFDRPLQMRPDGSFAPMVASEWRTDGDDTLRLTIPDGRTFQDGTPIDAEAVKANIDRARGNKASGVTGELAMVRDVQVDGKDVVIGYDGSRYGLMYALAHRAGALISPRAFDAENLGRRPVGSGPYRVTEFRTDDRVVMEPYEGYWNKDDQRLTGITMTFVNDDDTRLNGVRSGQYDGTFIRPEQIESASDAGLEHHRFLSGVSYWMGLNTKRSHFDDVRVRQALNYGIDREAISEELLLGSCQPSVQDAPQGHWAHEPALEDAYRYDPERARELLDEAGLADGFSFTALVWDNAGYIGVAEVLQDMLKEVGVDMKLRVIAAEQAIAVYANDRKADAMVAQVGGEALNPVLAAHQEFAEDGFFNPGGLSVPAIEAEIEKIDRAPDRESVAEAFRTISKEAAEVAYNVPVCNRYFNYAVTEDVGNFESSLKGTSDMRHVTVGR